MKKLRRKRSLQLSNSRWLAYATAGAATALGAASEVDAEIHYSGTVDARFKRVDGAKSFALSGGAKLVFLIGYGVPYNGSYYYGARFGINGAAVSNQFRGYVYYGFNASRIPPKQLVSQGDFLGDSQHRHLLGFLASSYGAGPWGSGALHGQRGGFVGFRFNNGNGMQYGWARLRVENPHLGAANGFLLVDYACGDPGDTITTGQTSSSDGPASAIPDQGSLGLLALGGAGLVAWRRRRAR